jgi:glycoprotein-N-acetylgalactosamine 3-beta-galactosyltransferase
LIKRQIVKGGYHSGGPGYLLSREAFVRLGAELSKTKTLCKSTGIDDVDIQTCLRELGVYPGSSLDLLKRERFLPLGLVAHFIGRVPDWFFSYSSNTFKKVNFSFIFCLFYF